MINYSFFFCRKKYKNSILKFSTNNNRTSDGPRWLRYRHCAKIKKKLEYKQFCVQTQFV